MTTDFKKSLRSLIVEQIKDQILIPGPPPEKVRLKELPEISKQYSNRVNPAEMQGLLDEKMTRLFDAVVVLAGYPSQKPYIKSLKEKIDPTILTHKSYFNSLRPNELADKYGVEFKFDDLKTAKTRSYPSGHTTQAYYIAQKLSDLHPELRQSLFSLAHQVSTSRVDRGVHFPSDLTGGILLANELLKLDEKSISDVKLEAKKRKPRKKGQHRNSPNHSDLFTDENPKGTIKGLKFATVKDAETSVNKIKRSGKSHAHKTQAAIAMEQRAKSMGKKSAAAVYRKFINQQKEKTAKKNESIVRTYVRQLLKEDPVSFVQDLAASDAIDGERRATVNPLGKEGGKVIKRAFAKHADHQWLSTLDTVHWTTTYGISDLKGRGRDELSTTMTLPGDELRPASGNELGLWVKGRITLAANDMDDLFSGFYGSYSAPKEGSEEEVRQRDASSGRNKRPTASKDYKKFRAAKKGNPAHEKIVREQIPYVLDQLTWNPSRKVNEALVDNWQPYGIVVSHPEDESIISGLDYVEGTKEDIEEFTIGKIKQILLLSLSFGVPIYSTDRTILWSPK